jgi:hypothetical protein
MGVYIAPDEPQLSSFAIVAVPRQVTTAGTPFVGEVVVELRVQFGHLLPLSGRTAHLALNFDNNAT